MIRVVCIYQCFFFSADQIEYWENIEGDSHGVIEALLSQRLSTESWEAAEAWAEDKLICRTVARVCRPTAEASMISFALPAAAAPA
jgi:hypothetical protein